MKNSKNKIEFDEKRIGVIVLVVFFILIYIKHILMTYISDDALNYLCINDKSLWKFFVEKYYGNGRVLTDGMAYACYFIPLWIWKIIDSFIYVVIAILLSYILTKKEDSKLITIATVCTFMLIFPIEYLSSAGYIATATNYLYPILGILFALTLLKVTYKGIKPNIILYVLSVIGIFYSANHDQSSLTLILVLIFLFIANLKRNNNNKCYDKTLKLELSLSALLFVINWFIPGHINRMNSTEEMEYWLPQYSEWSMLDKIYRGYSTTVANLIFNNVTLFILFCFLLVLIALISL